MMCAWSTEHVRFEMEAVVQWCSMLEDLVVVERGLINVRSYVCINFMQVPKLCSQPISYTTSEGKTNQGGTGRRGDTRHG
jgi:hypothetical protein